MGLAGPRKRTKLSHDPNNTNWSRSVNSFGHKILTAQGWIPGTFLGAKSSPHAQLHSTASASHIRVTLKDDNLGLGAKRRGGDVEGECTGLSAFQGLLGRLNGRTEEEVDKERKAREDVQREIYMENRWGLIKFVKGGFLVGDKIQEFVDDETGRIQTLTVTEDGIAEEAIGSNESLEGVEGRKPEKQCVEGSNGGRRLVCDRPDEVQTRKKKAKVKVSKKKFSRSDTVKSFDSQAHERNRKTKRRQRGSSIHSADDQSHAIKQSYITTTGTRSSTNSSSPSKEEKGEHRRYERPARKDTKRQTVKEPIPSRRGKERSEQSSPVQDPLFGADAIRLEGTAASPVIPTGTLPGRRHAVRRRYIQQKKMALLDAQALNEEALENPGFTTPIHSDANLFSAATGSHPIALVRNVAWEHKENRLARFEGFPKQSKLVNLKQQTVDEAEYVGSGCGPSNKGWGVSWYPFVNAELDMKGLAKRLRECRRPLSANSHANVAGPRQRCCFDEHFPQPASIRNSEFHTDSAGQHTLPNGDNHQPLSAEEEPLVFDTVLISPPPQEIGTEALRDLPIKELTTKPAFCFLWVRDSSEIELCSDIIQEWGFRTVERLAYFGLTIPERSLTRGPQDEMEPPDLAGGGLLPLLKDLGFSESSSELGLSTEDFLNFTPLGPDNDQAISPHYTKMNTWGVEGCAKARKRRSTDNFPEHLEFFGRTARFCLIGMNGKMRRYFPYVSLGQMRANISSSTDGHIVHSNIDPDVIISAGKAIPSRSATIPQPL
ncbi:hypothetical protein GP486_002763 [Trichoglossum hirsutum]|uniref:G-patch domain-containing protein n=1 Tax=Trichoglossum hirsutum TaxID=265104 RepID=A0A9P8RRE9_9PEZI|nr:hypothetical protein GP486_002763 [Trichoglossum hirsutum]